MSHILLTRCFYPRMFKTGGWIPPEYRNMYQPSRKMDDAGPTGWTFLHWTTHPRSDVPHRSAHYALKPWMFLTLNIWKSNGSYWFKNGCIGVGNSVHSNGLFVPEQHTAAGNWPIRSGDWSEPYDERRGGQGHHGSRSTSTDTRPQKHPVITPII